MEISVFSVTISILFIILLTLALKVANWLWIKPKRLEKYLRNQGCSGNSYKFLFGDIKEITKMMKDVKSKSVTLSDDIASHVLPFIHEAMHNHGKDCFLWIGPVPRVNITNPEQIKDVFKNFADFQKPTGNPLGKLLLNGLVTHEGDKWALHRKIINPAFHIQKLKLMLPAMYLSVNEMINKWEELSNGNGSFEVDVWPFLETFTSDVISRTAFGSSYKNGREIFRILKEQTELVIRVVHSSVYIPGSRFLPTKLNKRIKQNEKEVRSLIHGIMKKKQKAMKEENGASDDLLSILLESNAKEIEENKNKKNGGMSMEDVIDECKLFYFAGQESTSTFLLWTFVLLGKFPHWQKLAREEVFNMFGGNKPNYDGLSQLKIVTMIFYEVLRLYPVLAVFDRNTAKETKLGSLSIPAGVQVTIPSIFVHRDKQLWGEDADEFKPERFAEGISKATKNQFSYFPFGAGPRICIGQNFALAQAKIALAMILQRFTFELSPSYVHSPFSFGTLQPQFGCPIILHKL